MGARPEFREPVDFELGDTRNGWQHEPASRVEESFRETNLFPRMGDARKALVRSQRGSGAGLVLSTSPVNRLTTFTPQVFRVILLRRLHLPLPLTVRNCRCGHPLDTRGHHRAACALAGVLGGRGWALESVVARTCREAGGRVTTNVLVRGLGLVGPDVEDNRRLEVVADGLPLFGGAQLAIDTTVVSALRADGTPGGGQRPMTEATAEARLDAGNAGLTPSWLVCTEGRASWFSVEVGGRWSHETQSFLSQLAKASDDVRSSRGVYGGVLSWRAPSLRRWLPRCWNCLVLVAPMVTFLRHKTWSGIAVSAV